MAGGLGALLILAYVSRERLLEAWHLPRLESDDPVTRERAALALSHVRSARAAPRLLELALESRIRREVAIDALGRLGVIADAALLTALESADHSRRGLATEAWLARDPDGESPARELLRLLSLSPWRFVDAGDLPAPAHEPWVAALCGAARDERMQTPKTDRTRFVQALTLVAPRDERTLRLLEECLARDLADAELVATSLAPFHTRGFELLEARYGQRFSAAPDAVLGALARFGPIARGALPTLLARLDAQPSVGLALALPHIAPGHNEAISLLARCVERAPGVAIGLPFARALGDMGPAAGDAITSLLEGPAFRRALAASAAGRLGAHAAALIPSLLSRAVTTEDSLVLDTGLALAAKMRPDASLHELLLAIESRVPAAQRAAWDRAILATLPFDAGRLDEARIETLIRAASPAHVDLWRDACERNASLRTAALSRASARNVERMDVVLLTLAIGPDAREVQPGPQLELDEKTSDLWIDRSFLPSSDSALFRAGLERARVARTRILAGLSRQDPARATPDAIDWISTLTRGDELAIDWLRRVEASGPEEARVRSAVALLGQRAIDPGACIDRCLSLWTTDPARARRAPLDLFLAPGLRAICELGPAAHSAAERVEAIARTHELDGAMRVEAWIALLSIHLERHRHDALDALLARSVPESRLPDPAASWTTRQLETLRELVSLSPGEFLTALGGSGYRERLAAMRCLARLERAGLPDALRSRLEEIAVDDDEPWPLRVLVSP